mgnify:FL=1
MDTETLKTLYSGIKGYAIILTNILDEKVQDFEYIIDSKYLSIASFSLVSCVLLAIKEDVVEGTKENYGTKIFYDELLSSVDMIATKKSDGFYIDNHKFKDAASVVGELRNKIAHGSFKLNAEENKVIFNIDGDEVIVNISDLSKMIVSCLKASLKNPDKNIYKRELLISNKEERKRTKPFKNKDELLRFAKTFKIKTITLKSRDNSMINELLKEKFELMLAAYKGLQSNQIIMDFERQIKEKYLVDVKEERIPYHILQQAVDETFMNLTDDMEYKDEVNLLSKIIEIKRKPDFNLLYSLLKNLLLISDLQNIEIKDKKNTVEALKRRQSVDIISYNELVGVEIALFQSLFSYGNDTLFKNENEYSKDENTGLDYGNLDLSSINVLYFEPDETIKNEVLIQIASKNKQIVEMSSKIAKDNQNLENVKQKGNSIAIKRISAILTKNETQKQILEAQAALLNIRLNEIITYEQENSEHLKNKVIINGIRNSISHGNYKLETSINNEIKIVFEDIYEGKLTFKCEIDIIDFINMIYENQNIIIAFLNKNEQKLVRTKKS